MATDSYFLEPFNSGSPEVAFLAKGRVYALMWPFIPLDQ